MSKSPIKSDLFLGRRRGIPDEKDTYAYKETQAKSLARAKTDENAAQKKLYKSYYARVANICRDNPTKGICPICGTPVGKGISGHIYAHVRKGEADEWELTKTPKIESITTILIEPI